MGLVALVSAASVGLLAANRSEAAMRQQILDSNLAAADAVAGFTARLIEADQSRVDQMAADPKLIQAMVDGNGDELTRELSSFSGHRLIDSVAAVDLAGTVRASSPKRSPATGASVAGRDYFKQVLASTLPSFGVPVLSAGTGRPVATYAVPVADQAGSLRGVLAAGLSLSELSNIVTSLHTGPQAKARLVDRRRGGLIVVDADPKRLLAPASGNDQVTLRLLAGDRAAMETTDSTGQLELSAFAPVPHLPWSVLVQQPQKAAFAGISAFKRDTALTTGMLTLGAVAAGVGLAMWFTRPIRRLHGIVRRFSSGQFDARSRLDRRDEIGQLARAFDDVADQLQDRDAQLRSVLEDLERKVAERTQELGLANQALGREKATLDAVLGGMSDGLIVLDSARSVRYSNLRAADLLGLDYTQLHGVRLPDLSALLAGRLQDADAIQAGWERALQRPQEFGRLGMTLLDGQARDLEMQVFTVAGSGETAEWLGVVIRDVTAIRELSRTKHELVATVSHELRTPLASLVGFTELLLEQKPSEAEAHLYLSTMREDGRRLTELIDNFLDLQRMDAGGLAIQATGVDLRGVLSPERLAAFTDGEHPLIFDMPGDLPVGWAEEDALRAVIGNLLSNACKYSPTGAPVRIAARLVGAELEVSVQDNGIGLAPETLPKLFDKFFRVDNSDRRATQGAGLGLAISRELVNALGGRIWAESRGLGQGSRFIFTLRLAEAPASVPIGSS
ncbi:MAG TPA: ATP-binding protein [Chloroflexota bacterium]|nr:ATP-binding protein [Chloroflexota bacterium]